MVRVAGIDLAGSPKRDTGYCLMDGNRANALILHEDKEIIDRLVVDMPGLIAIDAPLSLPKGRKSIEERDKNHFRSCDLELRRLGIRFFPITIGPMRMLTKRGIGLKDKINKVLPKSRVIEVFPGATYDILGAKRKNRRSIISLFKKNNIRFPKHPDSLSQDELDGIACALTGKLYLEKKAHMIGVEGKNGDGQIAIPSFKKVR